MKKNETEDRARKELAAIYELAYVRRGRTLGELSANIGISKGYASLFLNGKLPRPTSQKLLIRIRDFVRRSTLTVADERILVEIVKLLERAHDESSVLAALFNARHQEAGD